MDKDKDREPGTGNRERETLAEIVKDMRDRAYVADKTAYNPSGETIVAMLNGLAHRIEAAAKRAYNEIDSVACGIDVISSSEIREVRETMRTTIGDYYE